jgi:membrane protease YdiL (CAAX protease family)
VKRHVGADSRCHGCKTNSAPCGFLILGLFWTGWHLPLFLRDNWSSSTLTQFWLIVSMLSFFITLGYNISGGNLWVVILMHATFNAAPRIVGPLFGSADVRKTPSIESRVWTRLFTRTSAPVR